MQSVLLVLFTAAGAEHAARAQAAYGGATIPVGSGFSNPAEVAVDAKGDVFVADTMHSAVKEIVAVDGVVSASSVVNAIGNGFSSPQGVAVDASGNVFVADTVNDAVKEILADSNGAVSASSTVITIGNGFSRPFSVAVDASGNVFVADFGNNAVKAILADGNHAVSASSIVVPVGSGFLSPAGVAVDANEDVFIGDTGNNAVKEVVAINGVPSSTPVTVGSGFSSPAGVAVDGRGDVYVADFGSGSVKAIVAVDGAVDANSPVIAIGPGFVSPFGVAVDTSGNVFAADYGGNGVDEFLSGTQQFPMTAVGSTSNALTAYFTFRSAGTLASSPYVVLTQGAQNLDFKPAPAQAADACVAGTPYNGGQVCSVAVVFSPTRPYLRRGAVQLMGADGSPIATSLLHGTGTGPLVNFLSNATATVTSGIQQPGSVALDGAGNLFVTDTVNNIVKKVAAGSGVVSTVATGFSFSQGTTVAGIAVDGSGNIFVADTYHDAVQELVAVNGVVNTASSMITVGSGFSRPFGVAVDGSGNVLVADEGNGAVKEIVAINGVLTSLVNTVGSGFQSPAAVAVDASGNVFVADFAVPAVDEIVAVNGVVNARSVVTPVGSGFVVPAGVAVDGNGNVFVADFGLKEVESIVAVNGAVGANSTVTAIGTGFSNPSGVAVDGDGNIFVADFNNGAVKEITLRTPPSLAFAATAVGSVSSDSAQTAVLFNRGNAPLTFTVPVAGNNASIADNFTLDSSSNGACPLISSGGSTATLGAGAVCTLPVSFAPTEAGNISGTLAITDTDLNSVAGVTQVIPLNGRGNAESPMVSVANATITYGTASTPLTASISFTGTAAPSGAATFMIDSGIAVPAMCTATASSETCTGNYDTSTLAVGTHAITASLAADLNYTAASGAGTLQVTHGTASVSLGNLNQTYTGSPLQATATTTPAGLAVSLTYAGSAAVPTTVGTYAVVATVNDANYTGTATGTLVISKATPALTWPTPAPITYGTTLSAAQLDPSTGVAGSFSYSPPIGTVLSAGAHTLTATFVPNDATDYNTASTTTVVTVTQAKPALTWSMPTAIPYGTVLSSTQQDATSPVAGSFTYSPGPGTRLSVGTHTLTASFTPTDTADYATEIVTTTIVVQQAKAMLTWPMPPAIDAGTALTSAQLDATSTVPGNFIYSPPIGTVLAAGTHTLTASFTPTDAADYEAATVMTTIVVNPAKPVFTWPVPAAIVYGTPLTSTQLDASSTVPGTVHYNPSAGSVLAAGTHILTATFTPADPASYSAATTTVTLTVNQALPVLTWAPPAAIGYGTPLSNVQLDPSASVAGSFSYSAPAGTVLAVGAHTVTATFTPTDAVDYKTNTASVVINVNAATLVAKANNASRVYGTANPAFTGVVTGANAANNFTESFTTTATTSSDAGSYAIVPSVMGSALSDYTVQTINGTLAITKAPTTSTISASASSITPGQAVALAAAVVSSTTGTPTGTVSFYNGATLLRTVTLNSGGIAQLSTQLASASTASITAKYSGDQNFQPSASGSTEVAEAAQSFTFTNAGASSYTVAANAAATYNFALAPVYGAYPQAVTFTVTGLPDGATATFTPQTVAADAEATTIGMTIKTVRAAKTTAANQGSSSGLGRFGAGLAGSGMALAAVLLLPVRNRRRLLHSLHGKTLAWVLVLSGMAAGLCGCGLTFTTAPRPYTLTVTATSGTQQRSQVVTLTVQ
ncbi:MBG domain-containing protein [Acidipila sp. EB88]|uniref:MBG domain-containing protein n=1 Tax=Acidipila sp. EB88 TaxID=2305226 RepID=UPI0013155E4D|nr:MBG domain-containing protein [Acidipila sp. EB88]